MNNCRRIYFTQCCRVILYSMLNLLFYLYFLAFRCGPTTMALLVTDSQWFLCHLEANSQHLWQLRRPAQLSGIWLQPYLHPLIFVLSLPSLGRLSSVFLMSTFGWIVQIPTHTPEVCLFRYLQSVSRVKMFGFLFPPLFFFFFLILLNSQIW